MANKSMNGNYQEVLQVANSFYNVSQTMSDDISLIFPRAINICFACELYLKIIKDKSSNNYETQHDIFYLYNQLEATDRANILAKYNNLSISKSVDLVNTLKSEGNSFIDWRYAFENQTLSFTYTFWSEFAIILKEYAESLISNTLCSN